MSINTEMTALADAIRAKSGVTGKLSISGMTSAVSGIVINPVDPGDIDLSVVTVTAADMLKGKVAVNAEGVAITGTIETVTASSDGEKVIVPAGFHAESKVFNVSGGSAIDLSFITAGASDILSGKVGADKDGNPVNGTLVVPDLSGVDVTADAILFPYVAVGSDGNPIVGNVQSVKLVVDDNVVTMPKGYSPGESATVPAAAAPTVESNVVTVNKGYQSAEQKITVGTAKAAETVTPGTADKTIAADTYLTGALTVKGDSNWKEENIAKGVSMWGKVGTFKGSAEFYKCTFVQSFKTTFRIEVSSAGNSAVNGYYYKTTNDVETWIPVGIWKHESSNYYMFRDEDRWVIADNQPSATFSVLYYTADTEPAGAEWLCNTGVTPPPTVIQMSIAGEAGNYWAGKKAILTDGAYSFDENEVWNLTYSSVTPELHKIYTADALAEIKSLYGVYDRTIWSSPDNLTANDSNPDFIVNQSSKYSYNTEAFKAFDGSTNIGQYGSGTYNSADYVDTADLSIQLSQQKSVNYLKLISCGYGNGCQPASFNLEYSDDGSTWTPCLQISELTQDWWNTPSVGSEHEWELDSNGAHAYYRLNMLSKTSGVSYNIQRMELGYREATSDTPDTEKEYVYTASGFDGQQGITGVDGDYWEIDAPDGILAEYDTSKGIFTNGTYYLVYFPNEAYWNGWTIVDDLCNSPLNGHTIANTAIAGVTDLTAVEWWKDEAISGAKIELYSGSTPDDSDKTYVYTVSGAGSTEANGDYYDSGFVYASNPIYTNGTCYMRYESVGMVGSIFSSYSDTDESWGTELYTAENVTSLINDSWYTFNGTDPAPTVTEYSGGTAKEYEYTVSSAPSGHEAANGNYWRTDPPAGTHGAYDTTNYGVWTNGTYYILFTPSYWGGWALTNDTLSAPMDMDTASPPAGRADYAHSWDMTLGELPTEVEWTTITITEYAGTPIFKVTGDETNPEVNGDYCEVTPDNANSCWDTTKKIYSNGTIYFAFTSQWWNGWTVVRDISTTPFDDQGIATSLAYDPASGAGHPWDVPDWNGDAFEITKY